MNPQIDPYSGNVPRHDPKALAEYISAVTKLAAEGKPVQYELMGINPLAWNSVFQPSGPAWDWSGANYRIDPASRPRTMQPWAGPNDVPKGTPVWLREIGHTNEWLLFGLRAQEVHFAYSKGMPWSALLYYEYSLDRITWHACECEVES